MFTIGQINKITGLSRDKLRYYEEKGIVSPVYDASNRYRKYTEDDLMKILTIEHYRSLDMGINEIQAIHDQVDVQGVSDILSLKCDAIENQIRELSKRRDAIKTTRDAIQNIGTHLHQLSLRPFGPYERTGMITDFTALCHRQTGQSVLESLVRHIRFDENGFIERNLWCIEPALYGDISGENTIYHGRCVYMVIEDRPDSADYEEEVFKRVMAYLAENHLQHKGTAFLKMILLMPRAWDSKSYLELFIPVSP